MIFIIFALLLIYLNSYTKVLDKITQVYSIYRYLNYSHRISVLKESIHSQERMSETWGYLSKNEHLKKLIEFKPAWKIAFRIFGLKHKHVLLNQEQAEFLPDRIPSEGEIAALAELEGFYMGALSAQLGCFTENEIILTNNADQIKKISDEAHGTKL